MNSKTFSRTSSLVVVALAAFAVVPLLYADEWDLAEAEIDFREDDSRVLFREVLDIRAKAAPRNEFLAPPEGTRLFLADQAELPQPNMWKFNKSNNPEVLDFLTGGGGSKHGAEFTFPAAKPGICYIWVCFMDQGRGDGKWGTGKGSLKLSVTQNGETVGECDLPKCKSPLSTYEGVLKYGVNERPWPSAVWQDGAVRVTKAGEIRIELTSDVAYNVKGIAVTDDPMYEPRVQDFYPMYLRIKPLASQKTPLKFTLSMFHIYEKSYKYTLPDEVPPGGDSGWFRCSRMLAYGTRTIEITADDGTKGVRTCEFEVEVSRVPDENGVFYRYSRKGTGDKLSLQFEHIVRKPVDRPVKIETDISGSERSLALATAIRNQKGQAPRRFPFAVSGIHWGTGYDVFVNEVSAFHALGCFWPEGVSIPDDVTDPKLVQLRAEEIRDWRSLPNPLGYLPAVWGNDCICSPHGLESIRANAEKKYAAIDHGGFAQTWDEPSGWGKAGCKKCEKQYVAFLQENGVTPADLGAKAWDDVMLTDGLKSENQEKALKGRDAARRPDVPAADADELFLDGGGLDVADEFKKELNDEKVRLVPEKAPERYYWSMRYLTTRLKPVFKAATDGVVAGNPKVMHTSTMSPDYVDQQNSIGLRTDWFDFFESGAMNLAQTEDWCNESGDYEVVGFLVDFIRGAARRWGQDVSVLDIICGRHPWEVTAKAFTEIGHGAKSIRFFGYGPHYYGLEYSASQNPEIYPAIKSVTYPVGAVEDVLLDGVQPKGDLALLFSVSTDFHMRLKGEGATKCGKERIWEDLLLSNLGYAVDIIDENGVKDFLKDYSFAWAGDFYLKRDALQPLVDWISGGGTLFMSAGALQYDEFGRTLGFDEAVGLVREKFDFQATSTEKVGGEVTLCGVAKVTDGKAVAAFDSGNPSVYEYPLGKGKVVFFAYLPGLSYKMSGWTCSHKDGRKPICASDNLYGAPMREQVGEVMVKSGASKTCFTDNPRVEAHLFRGKSADAVVLANWNVGGTNDVSVTIPNAPAFKSVSCCNAACAELSRTEDGRAVITVKGLPAGDTLRLEK